MEKLITMLVPIMLLAKNKAACEGVTVKDPRA